MNYKGISKDILKHVGGKSNVSKVMHCFTRLRLNLKDNSKINEDAISNIQIVKGCQINSGQFQIIIGNEVEDVYNAFIKQTDMNKEEVSAEHENKSLVGRFIDMITAIFIPVFPALVAGGLMKGILIAIQFSGVLDTSGTTFALLSMFSDAPFYFLPIILAHSAAKRFGCNPYVAITIAGIMLHPGFLEMGDNIRFFGISMDYVNYSSTVFPVLIGVYLMSWIEKGVKKISPKSLASLMVPLLTIFITAPLILLFVGPVANKAALIVGDGVLWMFENGGGVAGAIIGLIYPFLVFTGLHQAIPPIQLQNLAQAGVDPILAVAACANAAVAGTTLMVYFKAKQKDLKSLAASSALSAFIGITEPALYGVVSRSKKTFIASFAGGAVGGTVVAFAGVQALGMGPVPLAGIAVFFGDKFFWYIAGIVIAVVVSMVVTAVLGIDEENVAERGR